MGEQCGHGLRVVAGIDYFINYKFMMIAKPNISNVRRCIPKTTATTPRVTKLLMKLHYQTGLNTTC